MISIIIYNKLIEFLKYTKIALNIFYSSIFIDQAYCYLNCITKIILLMNNVSNKYQLNNLFININQILKGCKQALKKKNK